MRSTQFFRFVLFIVLSSVAVSAQTTEFTYQGSLKDGTSPANANYDLEFRLYADEVGGVSLGLQSRSNVPVSDGVFSVRLDFGAQFPGADRWLEVSVRPAGAGSFQVLLPRARINSAPYSVKSQNAENASQLGGVAANQYVVTTDPRMTDSRTPSPGSPNYIQNSAASQAGAFNITGNGTLGGKLSAQTVNASTRFEINNTRVLGLGPGGNLYVGPGAGAVTTGELNTFLGSEAGLSNTLGAANSFFGMNAGRNQVEGFSNSFFGRNAGMNHNAGESNSFFGAQAGMNAIGGSLNTYIGAGAGLGNSGIGNTLVGTAAGSAQGNANYNSFFGQSAGLNNVAANGSFFGAFAGLANKTGADNTFFGYEAGRDNTTLCCNAFFGTRAGRLNVSGTGNTFLGNHSGHTNTQGDRNVFVGSFAGSGNTHGSNNTLLGWGAGEGIIAGTNNTHVGYDSDQTGNGFGENITTIGASAKASGSDNSTAIGANAYVTIRDGLVLGSINGVNNAVADTNVGIGTTHPISRLHIKDNGGELLVSNGQCNPGFIGISFEISFWSNCATYAFLGDGNDTIINRFTGGVIQFREANVAQITINSGGTMSINALGSAGSTQLCRNASNTISTCSSSLRYKKDISRFSSGISFVNRLQPISFAWKADGQHDIGFGAEEIASLDPRLVTYNDKGEVEGVKYDRLSAVFVNAFKEQQAEIENQKTQISDLRSQLEAMKKLVCATNREAEVCK